MKSRLAWRIVNSRLAWRIIQFYYRLRMARAALKCYPWDYGYNVELFIRSLEISADHMERYHMTDPTKTVQQIRELRPLWEDFKDEDWTEEGQKKWDELWTRISTQAQTWWD